MRIDHLRVENFRGFAEREFAFHPQFNVLIGDNAAGKTATLEALAVALDSWTKGATGETGRNIRKDDARLKPIDQRGVPTLEPQYPVTVEARLGPLPMDPPPEQRPERPATLTDIDLASLRPLDLVYAPADRRVRRQITKPGGSTTSAESKWLVNRATELVRWARGGNDVVLPVVAYYGTARRQSVKDTEKKRRLPTGPADRTRLVGYRDALNPRLDPRLLTRWMEKQALITAQEDRIEPPLYTAVRNAIRDHIEGAVDVAHSFRQGLVTVRFEDGRFLPCSALSDGQRGMLELVGDLALRMASLNPGLAERALIDTPGVVLIDELDLHLHPRWQRRIVSDLRRTFPLVQFITTTHSPQIIGEAQPDEVRMLTEGTGLVPPPHQSYGLDTNAILEGLMGADTLAEPVEKLIREAENALEEGDLDEARQHTERLREVVRGDTPTTVRFDAIISNLDALADADDQ